MKKIAKRALCALLACTTIAGAGVGLAACDDSNNETVQLVIGVQQTTGNNYNSMCNLLDALKEELNFDYTTVLVDRNADAALSTYQNQLIAGAQGIITMVDVDASTTRAIIEDCEEYGAYYAGYMTDFANTFANNDSAQAANVEYIMNSDAMLGAVTDGDIVRDGGTRGEFLFNEVVKTESRVVTLCRAPLYAYPVAATAIERFKELAEEYNATHDDDFTIVESVGAADYGALEIGFSMQNVPDATVQQWVADGVEAVIAVNSLGKKILTNVQTSAPDIDIYQVGWDDNIISAFPDTIKTLCQTPAETIVYPLVRVLNAVRGNSYEDEPADKEDALISGQYLYITSEEELEAARTACMNFSEGNSVEYSLISVEEVKSLLAGEEGATFQKLVDTISSWTSENVLG